jgi:hypothetical protein
MSCCPTKWQQSFFYLEFKENTYSVYGRYGYGACTSKEEFTKKFINLYEKMILPSIPHGMCGCVYTQLSDVEDEINGLYTYNRKICKLEENELKSLSEKINSVVSTKTFTFFSTIFNNIFLE